MKYHKISNKDIPMDYISNLFEIVEQDDSRKTSLVRVDSSKINMEIKRGNICEGEKDITGKYVGNGVNPLVELGNNVRGRYIMSSPLKGMGLRI